jgi:hypothetical protein
MLGEHQDSERFFRCQRTIRGWWLILAALMLAVQSASALVITNVAPVNITPSSFSLVWASTPPIIPAISVYADAAGVTNLAGQVGIEFYPLHSGNPAATNGYDQRLSQAAIRQKSQGLGLVQVRVSGCSPGTTYYYRLQVSNNGQTLTSPASGPLPSVTTAVENSFVVQSRQLIITLPGIDVSGSIVTLANTNTPSILAAVAGDGVALNQVFFSVADLIAAVGGTNFLPLGNQDFTIKVLGTAHSVVAQTYTLNFTTDFLIGQADQSSLGQFLALSLGSTVLRAGDTASIPINFYASAVTNLSFTMDIPTNRFSALSLQGLAPQLSLSSMQPVASNRFSFTFATATGQSLQGNQQIAQLNFTLASNQPSAFVHLQPQTVQVATADASVVTNLVVSQGRLVVIGNEPLLESSMGPGGSRNLTLYGKPWASYEIRSSTNLTDPAGWSFMTRLPLTNLFQVLENLDASKPALFLRALEFTAAQPILDLLPGNQLVLYGTPWSAFVLEYAANPAPPTNWIFLQRVPLTNAFQFLAGLSSASNAAYRIRPLNAEPPVLDPLLVGQNRSLVVYGTSGTNYTLQYSTNLSGIVTWYPLLNYTLTNSFRFVNNLTNTGPAIFYRIKR